LSESLLPQDTTPPSKDTTTPAQEMTGDQRSSPDTQGIHDGASVVSVHSGHGAVKHQSEASVWDAVSPCLCSILSCVFSVRTLLIARSGPELYLLGAHPLHG
jgi:hypothetical protein